MPRNIAPPPSDTGFQVRLEKPFEGNVHHLVEVIGEPNRSATVKVKTGENEKTGDVKAEDVNELLSLVEQVAGFPTHPSKDIYGLNVKLEYATASIQWASDEADSTAEELGDEAKQTFKDIVDSIEALGRQFARKDVAI